MSLYIKMTSSMTISRNHHVNKTGTTVLFVIAVHLMVGTVSSSPIAPPSAAGIEALLHQPNKG
jgi:hypothetical protein